MKTSLITKREAAGILRVSLATVDRMIRDRLLDTEKYGKLPQSPVRLHENQVRELKRKRPPLPRKTAVRRGRTA